jgi:hypothetical protein
MYKRSDAVGWVPKKSTCALLFRGSREGELPGDLLSVAGAIIKNRPILKADPEDRDPELL